MSTDQPSIAYVSSQGCFERPNGKEILWASRIAPPAWHKPRQDNRTRICQPPRDFDPDRFRDLQAYDAAKVRIPKLGSREPREPGKTAKSPTGSESEERRALSCLQPS